MVQKTCLIVQPIFSATDEHLRYGLRIEITKALALLTPASIGNSSLKILFPAGQYLANLTPDGEIEVLLKGQNSAFLSFSQFREKVWAGEFVVLES